MTVKSVAVAGLFGVGALYIARQTPMISDGMRRAAPWNGKSVPMVPEVMVRNDWSAAWWAIPAVGAYYLSK